MKVAICGAGDMGGVHFDTFSKIEGVKVVAVSDPDAPKLGAFAGKGVKVYASSEEMIDKAGADVVSIATPTAFHARLAIRALSRGLHVFCEKPMARTVADGEAMVRAAKDAGRTLAVGYSLRFHEAYRVARDYMMSGRLGRVGTVRTSRCAQATSAWHDDIEANGGAAFELLTHDLDWLQWSLGPVKRVFARGLARGRKTVDGDYVLAVVRFASGVIAHLEGSLAEVGEFYATYEIAGDGGLISYDTRKSGVLQMRLLMSEGLRVTTDTPALERPFARQIASFVAAVREGRSYELSAEEALPALRLAAAVLESIDSGRPVIL